MMLQGALPMKCQLAASSPLPQQAAVDQSTVRPPRMTASAAKKSISIREARKLRSVTLQRSSMEDKKLLKRSYSDPSNTATISSKPKKHVQHLTDLSYLKEVSAKIADPSAKPLMITPRPPIQAKRRHKRVQSIDITNDPTSRRIVATL